MTKKNIILRSVEKDIPAWKRGLSLGQMKASAQLELALRDDSEQGTTYRVWDCLYRLGLRPMPKNKQISTILTLSRGNPLAFLFFLMEAFYKSSTKGYSISEQLLMSAICHIDLPITINELDRLLPPGHLSPEDQLELDRKTKIKDQCQQSSHYKKAPNVIEKKALPYFQKQPRPTVIPKTFRATRKPYKSNLPFQARVENFTEKPRWFAEYVLQPGKRIVKKIISFELSKLFDKIDALQSSSNHHVDDNGSCSNCHDDDNDDDDSCLDDIRLCDFHMANKKIEQNKFLVEAKKRCMKLVNLVSQQKENVRQLVTQQLEKDINFYLKTYGKNWQAHWYFVPTIRDENCNVCLQKVNVPRVPNLFNPHVRQFVCLNDDLSSPLNVNRLNKSDESENQDIFSVSKIAGNCNRMENCEEIDKDKVINFNPNMKQCKRCGAGHCVLKNIAVLNEFDMSTKTPICYCQLEDCKCPCRKTRQYFKAPKCQPNLPHHFDYENIFENKVCPDLNQRILEKAVGALYERPTEMDDLMRNMVEEGEDEWVEEGVEEGEEEEEEKNSINKATSFSDLNGLQRINVTAAIERCVNNILCNGVKKLSAQMRDKEILKSEEYNISNSAKGDYLAESELKKYFKQDHFDPHDDKLMESMLQAALNIMSKDRRFVLATFPDCHKISSLIEWIKQRYGLKYRDLTYDEFNRFKDSFGAVANMNDNFNPNLRLFLESKTLSFKYINKVQKWADCVKRKFFSAVDQAVLEQDRLLWEFIQPYRFRNLALRQTFFAYLAADNRSIPHYNVWH